MRFNFFVREFAIRISKYECFLSTALFAITLVYFSYAWLAMGSQNDGLWNGYSAVALDIINGTSISSYHSWMSLGYPIFLVFINKLEISLNISSVSNVFYVLIVFSLLFLNFASRRLYGTLTANISMTIIVLYLLSLKMFSVTVLSESLFIPLILTTLSCIILWRKSESFFAIFFAGILLDFSNWVRPLTLMGIGIPLCIYFLYEYFARRSQVFLKSLAFFLLGIILSNIVISFFYSSHFKESPPERSIALYTTTRLFALDGVLRSSNGPYSKYLMDLDQRLANEDNKPHREGALTYPKKTFEVSIKEKGIPETIKIFWFAGFECIYSYPFIAIRNTALNIISFFINYDLLYLHERRVSNTLDFPINPGVWSTNPSDALWGAVRASLRYPFWILAAAIILIPTLRNRTDLIFWLCLLFGLFSVAAASLTEVYLFRYMYPFYMVFIIPIVNVLKLAESKKILLLLGFLYALSFFIKIDPMLNRGLEWNWY
jgi:hypothetical protein